MPNPSYYPGHGFPPPQSVAALGNSQGTAAALIMGVLNNITGADGTKGVQLPVAAAGDTLLVYSATVLVIVPVYPQTGNAINSEAANAAYNIPAQRLCIFQCLDGANWTVMVCGPNMTVTQTVDPAVGNDQTQGYAIGSVWFNSTAGMLRWWECRDATTGAAKWVFGGADYANGGTNPPTEITQYGSGSAVLAEEGNINRQISAAGIQPGATGADNVLAVFSLPANSFDGAAGTNRGICITAEGKFGSTANNKDIKIIFNPATAVVGSTVGGGGTAIADTGVVATNGGGWCVQANVFKYGAANSNTQIGLHQQAQVGNAVAALLAPALITATENAAILIAITGNATTAASDIVFNFLEVNAMN